MSTLRQPQSPSRAASVRTAILADLDELAPLFDAYRQFYGQVPNIDAARRYLRIRLEKGESVVLLATARGGAAGFCQLYPTFCSVEMTPIYVLYDLFVPPEHRRTGVGRALLSAAERTAAENGMARMDLRTGRTNEPAQAAYESDGWTRDDRFFSYAKHVAVTHRCA